MSLTEEQQRRMEASRAKALALRASRAPSAAPSPITINPQASAVPVSHGFTTRIIGATQRLAIPRAPSNSTPVATKQISMSDAKRFKGSGGFTKSESKDNRSVGKQVCGQKQGDIFKGAAMGSTTVAVKFILVSRQRFLIEARYFAPLIDIFKSVDSRNYDPQTKNWSFLIKDYDNLVVRIKNLGDGTVTVDEIPKYVLSKFLARQDSSITGVETSGVGAGVGGTCSETGGRDAVSTCPMVDLSRVDEKLVSTLLPFQRQAVNCAVSRGGRVLIADDMGLGKTLEALAIAAYYRRDWPLLVVSPSSVQFTWKQQILDWLPSVSYDDVIVVKSSANLRVTGGGCSQSHCSIFILSYDIMAKCHAELSSLGFKIIIMDESHLLKNPKTARTKRALPLLKKAARVLLLSGTPALSRPSELYPQLSAIDLKFIPFHTYGLRYCAAKQLPWGWDYSGSSNLVELQLLMEEYLIIRRLKQAVLSELPSKCRTMIVLNPDVIAISKSMKSSHKHVNNVKGVERHGALLEYFHETGESKVKAVVEYVLDLLEADRKFLVFAHHQNVLDALEEAVQQKYSYIRIDGRINSEQRRAACELFQSKDSVRVAILSILAANAGIDLTAASLVVFAELFWNPGILVQAEDRVHRIGQIDSVNIQYLVARNTSDDFLWPLIQKKLNILSKAGLSKDDFSSADTQLLQDDKQQDLLSYFLADEALESQTDQLSLSHPVHPSSSTFIQDKATGGRQQRTMNEYITVKPEVTSQSRTGPAQQSSQSGTELATQSSESDAELAAFIQSEAELVAAFSQSDADLVKQFSQSDTEVASWPMQSDAFIKSNGVESGNEEQGTTDDIIMTEYLTGDIFDADDDDDDF